MYLLTIDKSIWLQILSFCRYRRISVLVISLGIMGCASVRPMNHGDGTLARSTEREKDLEMLNTSPTSLPGNFYLSISKPSEYELFLRSNSPNPEKLTQEEELTEIWESGLSQDTLKFLEASMQFDSSEILSTQAQPIHLYRINPYHSAFSVVSYPIYPPSSPRIPIRPTPPIWEDNESAMQVSPFFTPPVDNAYIIRGLNPRCWYGRGHCGVDIATAKGKGDNVRAVEDGIVLDAGVRKRYGYYAIILHKGGIASLYSHTLKDPDLKPCQQVKKQEVIAKVGESGNARSPHLHFEMIDLDKGWQGKTNLNSFIAQICNGHKNKLTAIRENLERLLFRKDLKIDPLEYIPNIARNPSRFRIGSPKMHAKGK